MNATPSATAGTLESNDILITISPSGTEGANVIDLESVVQKQFGPAITACLEGCLERFGLTGVRVEARDRGALDCTIAARMEAAVFRYREAAACR